MTHHRTGFPFHPVAGATGTDGHNISWTDGLSTQHIVEFPQHRSRAPCRGGFRRGFLARGAAHRQPAAETQLAERLYSGYRRCERNADSLLANTIAVDMERRVEERPYNRPHDTRDATMNRQT